MQFTTSVTQKGQATIPVAIRQLLGIKTNTKIVLIIRFLVNDDPLKVAKVEKLLKGESHKNILLDTVVAEIIWVLTSYYSLDKTDVIEKVKALIHVDTLECNAFLLNKALTLWKKHNISYIDAYLVAVAELGNMTLYTYDRMLTELSPKTIKEP